MPDPSDDDLDEETRAARVKYRSLSDKWVNDEDERTPDLAGEIHTAISDLIQKISGAMEDAEEGLKRTLQEYHGKLIEGMTVWEQRAAK